MALAVVTGLVVLVSLCLLIDLRDRRHGHRARPAGALVSATMHHRNDDQVIEQFVQAAEDRDWIGPR